MIRLDHAFSAFSGDIIGRICLDKDDNAEEFLDHPDFAPNWYAIMCSCGVDSLLTRERYNLIHTLVRSIPLFTGFPWIVQ